MAGNIFGIFGFANIHPYSKLERTEHKSLFFVVYLNVFW